MQAVLEPCTVKMTSLEESNQHNSGAKKIEDTIVERQDGYHAVKGVELGSRLRHTISYGAPAKELKDTDPQRVLGLGSPSDFNISHYEDKQKQVGDILGRD